MQRCRDVEMQRYASKYQGVWGYYRIFAMLEGGGFDGSGIWRM